MAQPMIEIPSLRPDIARATTMIDKCSNGHAQGLTGVTEIDPVEISEVCG
jgi:hypothetical protein